MKNHIVRHALVLAVFLLVTASIYSVAMDAPFVFDSKPRILNNPNIQVTDWSWEAARKAAFEKPSSANRPAANLSFAVNYFFHGFHAPAYRLVNMGIHVLAAWFLYLFVSATLRLHGRERLAEHRRIIAAAGSLLWLVHPVHTQSVTYIVQRQNAMAAMFLVLSMWCYVKGRGAKFTKEKWIWWVGVLGAWLLALGSKQIAAMLPFLILFYEWFFFRDLDVIWVRKNIKFMIATVLSFGALTLLYLGGDPLQRLTAINDYANNEFTLIERLLTQPRVILHYISLLCFPHPSRLNLDYDFLLSRSLFDPWTTLPAALILAVLSVVAVVSARQHRFLSFTIFWFFANLAIESSIVPVAIIYEHRTYLPSMLLFPFFVGALFHFLKDRRLVYAAMFLCTLLLAVWTFQRNAVWADPVAFWSDTVSKSPYKARPVFNLGNAYMDLDRLEAAESAFRRAMSNDPLYFKAYNNLGFILDRQGKIAEAISMYQKSIDIEPANAKAFINLGSIYAEQGNHREAEQLFRTAIDIEPKSEEAYTNMGKLMLAGNNPNRAKLYLREAVRLNPLFLDGRKNLGLAMVQTGEMAEGLRHLEQARALDPADPETIHNLQEARSLLHQLQADMERLGRIVTENPYNAAARAWLGDALFQAGKPEAAADAYAEALKLDPFFTEIRQRLGAVNSRLGRYPAAIEMFQEALRMEPQNPRHDYNLACVYSLAGAVRQSAESLRRAIEKGYDDEDQIRFDPDLENLRKSDLYKEIREQIAGPK